MGRGLRAARSNPVSEPTSKMTKFGHSTKPHDALQLTERERDRKIWPFKFHVTSAWQQEHGRHPTWDCSVSPLPAHKSPYQTVKQIWATSWQHAIRNSIISWHAGVRGCISLHAGAVLCQETSRFASTCRPGLHGSPEGNLMQTQRSMERRAAARGQQTSQHHFKYWHIWLNISAQSHQFKSNI